MRIELIKLVRSIIYLVGLLILIWVSTKYIWKVPEPSPQLILIDSTEIKSLSYKLQLSNHRVNLLSKSIDSLLKTSKDTIKVPYLVKIPGDTVLITKYITAVEISLDTLNYNGSRALRFENLLLDKDTLSFNVNHTVEIGTYVDTLGRMFIRDRSWYNLSDLRLSRGKIETIKRRKLGIGLAPINLEGKLRVPIDVVYSSDKYYFGSSVSSDILQVRAGYYLFNW